MNRKRQLDPFNYDFKYLKPIRWDYECMWMEFEEWDPSDNNQLQEYMDYQASVAEPFVDMVLAQQSKAMAEALRCSATSPSPYSPFGAAAFIGILGGFVAALTGGSN